MSPAASVTIILVVGVTSRSSMTCATASPERVSSAESELAITRFWDCMALFFVENTMSRLTCTG